MTAARKKAGILIVSTGGVLISLVVVVFGLVATQQQPEAVDKTADWKDYYRSTVSHHFSLPENIQVISATHTDMPIMGEHLRVEFKLGSTRPPEDSLVAMARASGFKPEFKRSPFMWDCGDACDLWRMTYLPQERVYVAEWGWD